MTVNSQLAELLVLGLSLTVHTCQHVKRLSWLIDRLLLTCDVYKASLKILCI